MKRVLFLLSAILLGIATNTAYSQVYEMFRQSFEDGERTNWHMNTTPQYATNVYANGSRSLRLQQSSTTALEVLTDTIDFSQDATLRYVTLEFEHINNIHATGVNAAACKIYVKRSSQSDNQWTQLTSQHYNMAQGGSTDFGSIAGFNRFSYADWENITTPSNDDWRSERFDINDLLLGAANSDRKLIFRFVVEKKVSTGGASGASWWIDNIRIRSSQNQIITPTINMTLYPDGEVLASSRGARIELDASTTVSQGIDPDSVFVYYRKASESVWLKGTMNRDAVNPNHYRFQIPLEGFDTLMNFYCVVMDASTNHNSKTFPESDGSYVTYRCVRSRAFITTSPTMVGTAASPGSNQFPFPARADGKTEMVFDSALLANAGYKAGAITSMNYTFSSNNIFQERHNLQIRVRNAGTSFSTDETTMHFTTGYFQTVYDSLMLFSDGSAGYTSTIRFCDTFFYAGKDIVMQIIYNDSIDMAATAIRTLPTISGKSTLYHAEGDAAYNYNAYDFLYGTDVSTTRPAFVFRMVNNAPLVYDMGVSSFIYPNTDTFMTSQAGETMVVRLRNYGSNTVNAVRISYLIDGSISGHYDWSGTLAGQDSVAVTIANTLQLAGGFHTVTAWVEDTLEVGSRKFRDHEPFNDTCSTIFIVCDGPLHGTKTIGGAGADYATIEEFWLSAGRCGIDDSLIVTVNPGTYSGFTVPTIAGLTATHYIVLRAADTNVYVVSDNASGVVALADVRNAGNIHFKGLNFVRRSGAMTNMIWLSGNSSGCSFINCTFTDEIVSPTPALTISALVQVAAASNITIKNGTFSGGNIGINLVGAASDTRARGSLITNCVFTNQNTNAILVANQTNIVVSDCEMYDAKANSSYVFLIYQCDGEITLMRNKILTTHGAGALGISDVVGSRTHPALIANNAIVCNDDGLSTQMTPPFNIIQGQWLDIVYNSVKMTAPERRNVSATTFGGGTMSDCRFMNNVIACMDTSNYAFNYTAFYQNGNTVNRNLYYSAGSVMNHVAGYTFTDIASWRATVTYDNMSVQSRPGFLSNTVFDLRTYNRLLKGLATPIAGVTTDLYGNSRSATQPCAGVFEFEALQYDFEPVTLLQPEEDNCSLPASINLIVRLYNGGSREFRTGAGANLLLGCQVNGGAVRTYNVNTVIGAYDSADVSTNISLSLPPNGLRDSTHIIKVWTSSSSDPNNNNDTTIFYVISRFHPAAPATITENVPYFTSATLTPRSGIDEWPVYSDPTAPKRRSTIFWYANLTDTMPIYVGDTYVTDLLRVNTTFYMEQRRQLPLIRMTQIQLLRSGDGITTPTPSWMANATTVAIQLTNVGEVAANLKGDTLMTVSPTYQLNDRKIIFDSLVLEPGQSIVVQCTPRQVGNQYDPQKTQFLGVSINGSSITANSGIAFVYRRNGIEDAVAIGGVVTASSGQGVRWSNLNVPSYVWGTKGIPLQTTSAGLIRQAYNGDSTDWRYSTDSDPMRLGSIDNSLMYFTSNGCLGDYGEARVYVQQPPAVDLELGNPMVPEGCGLGNEYVKVTVHNFGTQTVNSCVLNYTAGGSTVTETCTQPIAASDSVVYTFNTRLNMNVPHDSLFNVKIWVTRNASDVNQANDTTSISVKAQYTPAAPVIASPVHMRYATDTVFTLSHADNVVPVWRNFRGVVSDTGDVFHTGYRYSNGSFSVSYLAISKTMAQVGSATTTNPLTAFPSPYQSTSKGSKQQYIYTAQELRNMGLVPGDITSIAFFLKAMGGSVSSITYANYYISLGTTSSSVFSANNNWQSTSVCFHRTQFSLPRTSVGEWVTHELDTPFYWDGVSNIVVQVVYDLTATVSSGVQTTYTQTSDNTILYVNNNNVSSVNMNLVSNGTRLKVRPNIRFVVSEYSCESPLTMVQVILDGIPPVDVYLDLPAQHDTVEYASCSSGVDFNVKLWNIGSSSVSNIEVKYIVDGGSVASTVVPATLGSDDTVVARIVNRTLEPGRHKIKAWISVPGDTTKNNDTIETLIYVRFCAGRYSVGTQSSDYATMNELLDTLYAVGVAGPVVFDIQPGTYTGNDNKLSIGEIYGTNRVNTVTFHGVNNQVYFNNFAYQTTNYVFQLNGAKDVVIDSIQFKALTNSPGYLYGNILSLKNVDNITIKGCSFKVPGSMNNINASCIVFDSSCSNVTIANCTLDSGYYSICTRVAALGCSDIYLAENTITNFCTKGIHLLDVAGLEIEKNEIISGTIQSNRTLTGIYVKNSVGDFVLAKNKVYIIDNVASGKQGIRLIGVKGSNRSTAKVYDNMVSMHYTLPPTSTLNNMPTGMWIDSSCAYLNIYFNSVRINAVGTSDNNYRSAAFYAGLGNTQINVLNNIFANFGEGYAYEVRDGGGITTSDFNNYYTLGTVMARWGNSHYADLPALQVATNKDANSLQLVPYFTNDTNLYLVMTNFVGKAQYSFDVIDDIDGNLRRQIPAPTIGAHEIERSPHDMSIVRVDEPIMPEDLRYPTNIEGDSVRVSVLLYNNGNTSEQSVRWYAYIADYHDTLGRPIISSDTTWYTSFISGDEKYDSVFIPTRLGMIDTFNVYIKVEIDDDDDNPIDNTIILPIYLAPAYDMQTVRMSVVGGCRMDSTFVDITLKNVGFKDFRVGDSVLIGMHNQAYTLGTFSSANPNANRINIRTLRDTIEEYLVFQERLGVNETKTYTFKTPANMYPTGLLEDISILVNGWCHYEYDLKPGNDSTGIQNRATAPVITSNYTPNAPRGFDTIFDYATWGSVRAEQDNAPSTPLSIRWHRDSTWEPFYAADDYLRSTIWSNTPQYFNDSTYYLSCISSSGCTSYYSPVHVAVRPRVPNDIGFDSTGIVAPLGSRVYMENDTVIVRIINFGTQPQSNFNVVYQLLRNNVPLQTIRQACTATVTSGNSYLFRFDTLLNTNTPLTTQEYRLMLWTELNNDAVRRNDTLRIGYRGENENPGQQYVFRSLGYKDTICRPDIEIGRIDITRVQFGEIDFMLPPVGRTYTDLGDFENLEQPVMHVTRGMEDSIFIDLANIDNPLTEVVGMVTVYIDYDRSGTFDYTERAVTTTRLVAGVDRLASVIAIPYSASYGYMKMRIVALPEGSTTEPCPTGTSGHVVDFLLFVDEEPTNIDLAIVNVAYPTDFRVEDGEPTEVKVRISNRGSQYISEFTYNYTFVGEDSTGNESGSQTWRGSLRPGASAVVTLPAHVFPVGMTQFTINHDMPGDVNSTNNELSREFYRFHVKTLDHEDNFDGENFWYAPAGNSSYSKNFWQKGTPHKANIIRTVSAPNAWVTDLTNTITTGVRGSMSYLYSPIYDISNIRPDTLEFRLLRDIQEGSALYLEYYDYRGAWVKLAFDSMVTFYNNEEDMIFDGASPRYAYTRYWISLSQGGFSGFFPERFQFRFVYRTSETTSIYSSFGDGCAIDNIHVGRAQRPMDVGVIKVVEPMATKFGQTYYPEVVVKNYGYDTATYFQIGYIPYGASLANMSDVYCSIPPGGVDTFQFNTPFTVTKNYPEEFDMSFFTSNSLDVYWDNDTLVRHYMLAPLDHDVAAVTFIQPTERVIAGDTTVRVTIRMRNFGIGDLDRAYATIDFNERMVVTDTIDFIALMGRPLESMEYYNYTFTKRFKASMGVMDLVAYVSSDTNEYIYNDTITKRINGISSVLDVAAASMIVDTSNFNYVRIEMVIENRGARGANDFEVGYWIDNDSTTKVSETYHTYLPLPALTSTTYLFSRYLPTRPAGYRTVTGFVHIANDNDPSNDTTQLISIQQFDLSVDRLIVEENADSLCRVFMQITNVGNLAQDTTRMIQLRASINGETLRYNVRKVIEAYQTVLIEFPTRIHKSDLRQYVGTGAMTLVVDVNTANNQTSIVDVVNYVEGIPSVNAGLFVLDQNYPNPFNNTTTIPFSLVNDGNIHFFVMDAMGRMVYSQQGYYMAGDNRIVLDMTAFATGIYYYGIEVDGERKMRKMILR